jgi:DNA-directed RNA polymerase specialized sigma54-like protein
MLKQNLQFKLSQKLSPQQIQLMKLIQLPTLAFEQRLLEEMNENPALESGKEEDDLYEKDEFDNNEDYANKLYEILYNKNFHMDLDYVKKFNSDEVVMQKYNERFEVSENYDREIV